MAVCIKFGSLTGASTHDNEIRKMGKLKRLNKTVAVDSDSDIDFGGSADETEPSPSRRVRSGSKNGGAQKRIKSTRRNKSVPLTKKELKLKAELADLLGREDGGESSSSGGEKSSEDNFEESGGESSSSDDGSDGSLSDLAPTSEEDESEEESGPTQGKILKLTAMKRAPKPLSKAEEKAAGRRAALEKLKERRQSRSQLSSESEESDGGGMGAAGVRGRLRKRIGKTAAIDVDMLEEAERGHAMGSDGSAASGAEGATPLRAGGGEIVLGTGGIVVPAILGKHLQHHQVEGVKFMHDSAVVQGKGCVLAHCMGLGKTLQAVTLISTLLQTPTPWEGDEGDPSIERKGAAVPSSSGTARKIPAFKMPVGELRSELLRRGVRVKNLKKKEMAELLEQKWRKEAREKEKKADGCQDGGDSKPAVRSIDSDFQDGPDDNLDVFGNKKRRPRTALVVCPVNVLRNWEAEFDKWLGVRAPEVYSIQAAGSSNAKRAAVLEEWHQKGGVMICGYDQYRNLTAGTRVLKEDHRRTFQRCLVSPGPLLLVCDEGHILRNAQSGVARALNAIGCLRRIVLTGTPLQNNLLEYHCMIDFVRPGLLGSASSFQREFVRVIENGQCEDSTAADVRVMKQRAHVLHGLLRVCVHRADLKVLEQYLPPKHEYALKVRMSPLQQKLYKTYLSASGHGAADARATGTKVPQIKLFEAYTQLAKVWTHPGVLKMERDDMGRTAAAREVHAYDSIDDFVCESSDEDWSDDEEAAAKFDRNAMGKGLKRKSSGKGSKKKKNRSSYDSDESECSSDDGSHNEKKRKKKGPKSDRDHKKEKKSADWWETIMSNNTEDTEAPELSGKMLVLLQILKEAAASKEKILLFSQSLMVLELIERVLDGGGNKRQRWKLGRDYFRLDGSTSSKTRQGWVERFNDRRNRRARLFLISTKAGGLGVNLSTASRVVIFDAAWNPSVDSQAVFRAFRFGQTKQVFVYRLLAAGTMEEKIYHRQVNKNALASRVVDKEQKDRHFKAQELGNLYDFDPEGIEDTGSGDDESGKVRDRIPRFRNCTNVMPSDPVLVRLLGKMQPKWLLGYADHDALATGEGETELSAEEEKAAWAEYEAASKAQAEAQAEADAAQKAQPDPLVKTSEVLSTMPRVPKKKSEPANSTKLSSLFFQPKR